MGASKSKAVTLNENNTLVINKTTLDLLNEQNNSLVTNVVMNQANKSSASILQSQSLKFKGLKSGGDINIKNITQLQKASVSFKSVQANDVKNEVSSQIMQSVLADISSKVDTDVINKMIANAESASKTGGFSLGYSQSDANTANKSTTTLDNTTEYKLKNIINTSIENNFKTETLNECIGTVRNNQDIVFEDITSAGNQTYELITQEQAVELLQECINSNGITNDISTSLSNLFGVKVEEKKTSTTDVTQEGKTTSTAQTESPLTAIGSMFNSIFSGYAYLIGGLSFLCFCCCCLIILMFLGLLLFSNRS